MSGDNDLLERATRALRATPLPSDHELLEAKQRLLAAQRMATKSSRARTLRWVLPLAAMLAAGSAFAAVPGSFERVAQAVSSLLAPQPVASHKPKERARSARASEAPRPAPLPTPAPTPASTSVLEPQAEPSVPAVTQALADDDTEARRVRAERRHRREARATKADEAGSGEASSQAVVGRPAEVEPAPLPAAPEPEHDRDLALYREAHEKHFRARDFAAALRAWNAYLAAFPSGTFAVEARYNRAICLVRLDQKVEARRALLPFSRGEVARGYRQGEATKLLKALE
jgi:hypothetical protein